LPKKRKHVKTCSIFFSAAWDEKKGNIGKYGKRQRQDTCQKIRKNSRGKVILIPHANSKFNFTRVV